MGYLINPIAVRIGWVSQWVNNYYIDYRYYPELLYIVFRVRLYILYLFKSKEWKRQGWLYSHYWIQRNYWGITIKIYYYDGPLESEWRKFAEKMNKHSYKWSSYIRKAKIVNGRTKQFVDFYTALVLSRVYKRILINKLPKKIINKSILNINALSNIKKWWYKSNRLNKNGIHILLYYNLLFNIILQQNRMKAAWYQKNKRNRETNLKEISRALFYYARIYFFSRPFMQNFSFFLNYILKFMHKNKLYNYEINFFMITNEYITANFLVIYITERIRQKYSIKHLMNPLMRELNRVRTRFVQPRGLAWRSTNKKIFEIYGLHRKTLYYLFRSYHRFGTNALSQNNTWINYDSLLTQYKICQYYFKNNIKQYLNSNQKKSCFGLCRTSFAKRANIIFFVKARNFKIYRDYLLGRAISYLNNKANLSPDYYMYMREMFNDYYENFSSIKNYLQYNILSKTISFLPVWNSLKIGVWGLIKYNTYNIFKQNMNKYNQLFQINKKKFKVNKQKLQSKLNGVLGFKFQFRGRFTRKQIAAVYRYSSGKMPLTALNADIDYAFRTVAIKNSAVGVKVWLYKGSKFKGSPYFCKVT